MSQGGHCYNLLECVQALLPASVALDTNLYTPEDHLLAAAEINTELDDVTIFYAKGLGLDVGLAETDVVEKGARGALDILDIPAAVLAPQLAVLPADDLGLEANGRGRGGVCGDFGCIVAFRVAANTQHGRLVGQGAGDCGKYQRGPAGSGVLVGDEANRGQVLDRTARVRGGGVCWLRSAGARRSGGGRGPSVVADLQLGLGRFGAGSGHGVAWRGGRGVGDWRLGLGLRVGGPSSGERVQAREGRLLLLGRRGQGGRGGGRMG